MVCTLPAFAQVKDIPSPPPPSKPTAQEEEIFKVVEHPPRFPGCEDEPKAEREKCAEEKMYAFFYKHLKYPASAKEKGITGVVKASFIVEKDGRILNETIEQGLTKDCDQEVLRVIQLMTKYGYKWNPIKARGRPVKLLKEIEIEFSEALMETN